MDRHQADVIVLSRRMKSFYEHKQPYSIFHGATNSARNSKAGYQSTIDISNLNHILKINKAAKTVLVEPNVPMGQLLEATLAHGLLPSVVPEFPSTTVGAGYSGTCGQSSSFKHGFFDKTINWVEFILPDGRIVGASESERPDLFYGASGAYGTLAVPTCFEMQLIDAKTYVELTLTPCDSASRTRGAVDDAAEDPYWDYVDGIIFAKDRGVLITGKLTDAVDVDTEIHRFTRGRDPWFYTHIEKRTRKLQEPILQAVPITDYLFRYDRGTFWTGSSNVFARSGLGDVIRTSRVGQLSAKPELSDQYIVQDLALPSSKAQQFIEYLDDEFGIYPLWLCPLQAPEKKSMQPHPRPEVGEDLSEEPMMNVGLWGPGPSNYESFVAVNRKLEEKVGELGGMKWLGGQAYHTEAEFWSNFNREWYDGLRRKYRATHLPSIYDKVKTHLPGLSGPNLPGDELAAPAKDKISLGRRLSKRVGLSRATSVRAVA